MIQVLVTPDSINSALKVIQGKAKQAEVIVSPKSLTEIAKAIFTITVKKFLFDLQVAAKSDSSKYHHLYEWGEVGNNSKKLFLVKRLTVQYGDLSIGIVPLKSSKPVPIPARLLDPGPTGKTVIKQSIFSNKMQIMEENKPIHYMTKKTVVFSPDGKELVFVPKGTIIDIMNPGGPKTTHALLEFSEIWYKMKAPTEVERSRLILQIGNEVAKVLNSPNSTATRVYETVRSVSNNYGREITTL